MVCRLLLFNAVSKIMLYENIKDRWIRLETRLIKVLLILENLLIHHRT